MKLVTVKAIYRKLNTLNFGGVLTMPTIKFNRCRTKDGFYDIDTMQFNLADTKGFNAVTELIYHEMIHQYIDTFLKLEVIDDHGKEFKKHYNKFSFNVSTDMGYCYD